MADTARVVPRIVLFAACFILSPGHAETLDRRCLQGDCVSLEVDKGTVLAHRTGAWPATRKVGSLWARARGTIPATEAPIMAATATHGWSAVIAAYLPTDFDAEGPELKLYLFDSSNRNRVVHPMYNFLNSFNIGKLLGTNEEFVQVSTTGVHAYVVRTIVIRLGDSAPPEVVMDTPGILSRFQPAKSNQVPGAWLDRQTYDGHDSRTKGVRREFWMWYDGWFKLTEIVQ